jgi:hypothetical protein
MSGPYQRSREVRMVRRKDDARKVSKEAKHFDLDYTLNFLIRKVIRRSIIPQVLKIGYPEDS